MVHPSVPKLYGQNQNLETATYLRYNDSSNKNSELNTDVETAYEPIRHPSSRQCGPLQRLKLTILLLKKFRQTNLVSPWTASRTTAPIPMVIFQIYTDIAVCKILFQPLQCVISVLHPFTFLSFFLHTQFFLLFYSWGHRHTKKINNETQTRSIIFKTNKCSLYIFSASFLR